MQRVDKVTNSERYWRIRELKPFYTPTSLGYIKEDEYRVLSYGVEIATINIKTKKPKWFDNSFYSTTTSRLQNDVITALNLGISMTRSKDDELETIR